MLYVFNTNLIIYSCPQAISFMKFLWSLWSIWSYDHIFKVCKVVTKINANLKLQVVEMFFWHIANWFNYLIFLLTHLMMNINFWVPWWPCFITMLFPWYENSIVTYSLSIFQLQFNKQYITKIAVNKNLPN